MTARTDSADIRLLDFGLGKIIGPNETCTDPFGTLSYVAPEILLEEPYNSKVDMWAIGIISYLLLAGFLPFDSEVSEKEIAIQTVYEPTPFPPVVWTRISLEAKMFVDNLLNKNPKKRMTIKEVLEYKWLQKFCGIDNDTILKRRKSKELSGGEQFKIYATLDDEKKK